MTNPTQALTLTEFLLARLAEDEVGAKHIVPEEFWPSLRSLRDVEAKRRIVRRAQNAYGCEDAVRAVVDLASVYRDHPDWREQWA